MGPGARAGSMILSEPARPLVRPGTRPLGPGAPSQPGDQVEGEVPAAPIVPVLPERARRVVAGRLVQGDRLGLLGAGLEPQLAVAGGGSSPLEVAEHRSGHTPAPARGIDVQPLQLAGGVIEPADAAASDRFVPEPCNGEAATSTGFEVLGVEMTDAGDAVPGAQLRFGPPDERCSHRIADRGIDHSDRRRMVRLVINGAHVGDAGDGTYAGRGRAHLWGAGQPAVSKSSGGRTRTPNNRARTCRVADYTTPERVPAG